MPTHRHLRDAIAALSDSDIMAKVGPATWAGGLTSHATGKVLEIADIDDGRIRGRVKGSGVTYSAWIAPGSPTPELTCACNLGQDCRHAVAVLLAVRADEKERLTGRGTGADGVPDWRAPLKALIGHDSAADGDSMGLLINTSDPKNVWISPLRPGRRLPWVTKRAGWPDVTSTQWESVVADLNPTHVALMREGYRLSREGVRWHSVGEVALNDLGDGAWQWLRNLSRAGVTLLSRLDPIEELNLVASPWELSLDASLDSEALRLTPVATCGSQVAKRPAIVEKTGIVILDGGLSMAHLSHTAAVEEISSAGITIPATDVAEFRATWLHALRSHMSIVSTDGTWAEIDTAEAHMVATLRLDDEGRLNVRWWFEYTISNVAQRAPFDPNVREPALRELARRIDRRGIASCPPDLWKRGPANARFPGWFTPLYLDKVVSVLTDPELTWDISPDVLNLQVHGAEAMDVDLRLEETDRSDWFDLRARILIAGQEVELATVLQALAAGERHLYINGVWVALDGPRLGRLRQLLEEAATLGSIGNTPSQPRLHMMHLGLWDEISDLADRTDAAQQWRQRLEALNGDDASAALPVPQSVAKVLRPYQVDGHKWLTSRAMLGLGGILADDMGLGKTFQILSAITALRTHSQADAGSTQPVLVVAPTSVLGTWRDEAARFFPQLRLEVVASTRALAEAMDGDRWVGVDVVVTSYTIARLEVERWAGCEFSGMVLDEAQAVKNPTTAIHRALRGIDVPWCFAVTGTPVENTLTDLWSILALTSPGLLPGRKIFDSAIRRPVEAGSTGKLQRLHALTGPFILRRTKEEVAADLPDKVVQVVPVELGTEHRRLYDQYLTRERTRLLGLMNDFGKNRFDILASLTRLRQLALDPALVDERHAAVGSAKIEYLADQLDEIVPRGHRVLVFSQFTSFLARIRTLVERRGHTVVQLDGSTRDRQAVIDQFRAGQAPVFLISLKAGGTGLTLTEADYVFVMDPWWNPAAEEQAVDRAHRIGQTKKVNVYRLAAVGTVEEKVLALQERKRELVSAVVDGAASSGRISVSDLRRLIEES